MNFYRINWKSTQGKNHEFSIPAYFENSECASLCMAEIKELWRRGYAKARKDLAIALEQFEDPRQSQELNKKWYLPPVYVEGFREWDSFPEGLSVYQDLNFPIKRDDEGNVLPYGVLYNGGNPLRVDFDVVVTGRNYPDVVDAWTIRPKREGDPESVYTEKLIKLCQILRNVPEKKWHNYSEVQFSIVIR